MSRRNAHGPRNALEEMDPGLSSLPDAIEQIRAERDRLKSDIATLGTVEMMIRNPNIDSWVREHEERLGAAEAERDILRRRVEERAHDCANVEAELETSRAANAHLIGLNVKLIEERDRLREEVRVLELQYDAAAALDKLDSEDYERQIDRLTRALAEREAVCQSHMELRYNAERERDEALTQVEYERDQRKLTVMAYDDERSEIKRVLVAFHRQEGDGIMSVRKLAKRLHEASASPAELGEAGYFSPASPPSSWGTDE